MLGGLEKPKPMWLGETDNQYLSAFFLMCPSCFSLRAGNQGVENKSHSDCLHSIMRASSKEMHHLLYTCG